MIGSSYFHFCIKLSILIYLGGKTGNGTIVIALMIENNYPVSTSKRYVMCKDKKPICINATDIDLPMSTIPFHFEIEKPMDLKWKLTPNDGMFLVFNIYKIHCD